MNPTGFVLGMYAAIGFILVGVTMFGVGVRAARDGEGVTAPWIIGTAILSIPIGMFWPIVLIMIGLGYFDE